MAEVSTNKPIKVFYSYASKDKALRSELENHLEVLRRTGKIITWYDRQIMPGLDWKNEINRQLNDCELILLLISTNFISSDYCYGFEMQHALEKHKAGLAYVIPIILRPVVDWEKTPIGELQVLPNKGKAVTTWRNRDKAFQEIVIGISSVVDKLYFKKNYKQVRVDEESYVKANDLLFSILSKNAPKQSEADKVQYRRIVQKFRDAPSLGPEMSTHPVTHSPYQLKEQLDKAALLSQSILIKVYSKDEYHYIGLGKDGNGEEKPIEALQLLNLIGESDLGDWISSSMDKNTFSADINGYQLIVFDYSKMINKH